MIEPELLFDTRAPGFTDDPYPHYAKVRATDPIHQHPQFGFWFVSTHGGVSELLRGGMSVDDRNLAPGPLREQYDQLRGKSGVYILSHSMLGRDPPHHTRLRSLVAKVFTRRSVAALEPRITELVDEALDRIADAGRADLVEHLAFSLPFAVISEMLGMPPTDHARIRELSGALVRSMEVVTDEETIPAAVKASQDLSVITRDVIAWKRGEPADDLLTALIAAEQDGAVLTDEELVAQIAVLYVGGHETTVNLISNGVLALLRNPDQLELLCQRPELIENAVEELLRYDSPVQLGRRITTETYRLAGKEIAPGSFVLAGLGSANRDQDVFGPDADRLRLDRPEARNHVSFGARPHHCIGAALARLEGRIAIGRLVSRFGSTLALDGPIEWNGRVNLRGLERLPVSV